MSLWLLDTDRIIDVLNGQPNAARTIEELAPGGPAISLVDFGELYEGAHYGRDRAAALAVLRDFLGGKGLLPVTEPVVERFAIVRGSLSKQLRQQVGELDLLIAATASTHGLTLLTRNRRDFQPIPDLKLRRPS